MPIYVPILWHMHQPNYQEPRSDRLALPWVRLHAVKDYLDMPLLAAERENVKVTFNLVPALLDQLQLYTNGGEDRHLELSRLPADQINSELRYEILTSFFSGNPATMIEPYPRYAEIYRKYRNNLGEPVLPELFTSEEIRDLQVWSNLSWVDPLFREEEPVRTLMLRGRYFTEDQKNRLLSWQIDLIGRIVSTYRSLLDEGHIDVSFTPYYHPILPLLCDTEVAREAIPTISLPSPRFRHPEDAREQIALACRSYEQIFGRPMTGMWPSEGSVSPEVADLCRDAGIEWIASDEEVLYNSLRKSGDTAGDNNHYSLYEYGNGLKMFFRDHTLSDRIGFVYSSWDPERSVADLISGIRKAALRGRGGTDVVVPIILDGENAWEYYANDGRDFLRLMYEALDKDPEIETITMTEAARRLKPTPLRSLFAGSWINHNFRIWIGHHEDNAAWEHLARARQALVDFQDKHPDFDPDRLAAAWRQIYIAEGSDWCWWYGDEHRGSHNEIFDRIFRRHLIALYEILDLNEPEDLWIPITHGETRSLTTLPEALLTPVVDGEVTHFYEWAGAGTYDCREAGTAMHRVDRLLSMIYFAYDHNRFYIRLDFDDNNRLVSVKEPTFEFVLAGDEEHRLQVLLRPGQRRDDEEGRFGCALNSTLEFSVPRTLLWKQGFGGLEFSVTLLDGDRKLETWPEGKPIAMDVYEKNKELFWP